MVIQFYVKRTGLFYDTASTIYLNIKKLRIDLLVTTTLTTFSKEGIKKQCFSFLGENY